MNSPYYNNYLLLKGVEKLSFDFLKDKNVKIHFIGIGGISMSGLAEIMLKNNFRVSGSDMSASKLTSRLSQMGAEIYIGHNESNIKKVDLVVYTAAIPDTNPELIYAREHKISLMDRAEFLGSIMKGHKYNIAISGTHGKTTTTSMLSYITLDAKLDPTILVGGELDLINGNVRASNSDYFITEACEYKASFLKFFPYIGVILNIDADHLDFYKDIDDIANTFKKFASLIPVNGYLIANAEDARVMNIADVSSCNVVTFGIDKGDIQAFDISYDEKGCASFNISKDNKLLISNVKLNVPGAHNILNALAAVCSALCINCDISNIKNGLSDFCGTHRRFEIKGVKNDITVIDDYAHHPTEIKATLKAAKNFPHKRIICIFQPHTYSRTITLFNEFSSAFNDADKIILNDIYAAREKDTGIVSSDQLGSAIRNKGLDCINFHSFDDTVSYLKENSMPGDLILTVGAGNIYQVGDSFLELI